MQQVLTDRSIKLFRIASVILLSLAALFFVCKSFHWRWQWDTTCIHYVDFLIDHGKAPYRDIIDMNMPGAFFMEGWAIDIFGGGDIGWRIYEYCLLAALTGSMIIIAKPQDWLAGLYAGVMFVMVHGAEGPQNAVQREEVMTVMLMAGMAFAFTALRSKKAWLMLPFGFLFWLAISLKPTVAPLGIVVLALAVLQLRRRQEPFTSYFVYGCAGFAAATAVIAAFLIRYRATEAFLAIMSRLLPYYATMANEKLSWLIINLMPRKLIYPILFVALYLTYKNRGWRNWERQALAVAVCFGAVSFVAQGKGFLYHRYPMLAFLFLWIALEFTRALKMTGWVQRLGLAGLAGFLFLIPGYCRSINKAKPATPVADMLVADLEHLGGSQKLQNQVQCLDMVDGCFAALYRLGLVQNTGFVSDFMFFGPRGSTPSSYYRNQFLEQLKRNPPQVIVVTSGWHREPDSFDKLNQWPSFVEYLNAAYSLNATKMAPSHDQDNPHGYRIYLLKEDGPKPQSEITDRR